MIISSLLFALLFLAFTSGSSPALLFLVLFARRSIVSLGIIAIFIILLTVAVSVFVKAEHIEVLVHTKVILESIWNKEIMEIFDGLLDLVDLVSDIVLLLRVGFVLLRSLAILEDVEE